MNAMNDLNILYEDNHIIVVVKPNNILSQSDSTHDIDMLTIIKKYIKEKYNKPGNVYVGLVHRLDRPVGGVMVFAKSSKAASRLSESIKKHDFTKKYLAIVNGILKQKEGQLTDYLLKQEDGNTIVTNKEKGKIAILDYKVLGENKANNLSLVEISLLTGRHHQIRVQFASRGYPLYGDQRYGKEDKKQLALFCYKLEFIHPVKKEKMSFIEYPNYGIFKEFKECFDEENKRDKYEKSSH
jgi:23S rRNA pseudouridine1911/1915/1917 synthase